MVASSVSNILGQLRGAFVAANDKGIITSMNQAAADLLGWDQDQIIGKSLHAIIPGRMHAAHDQGFQHFLESGHSQLVGRPVRVPAVHADGSEKEVDLTVLAYEDPERGFVAIASVREPDDTKTTLLDLEEAMKRSDYKPLISPAGH